MSIDLAEIKSRMPSYNPNSIMDDIIRWLPPPIGIYFAASAMESLKTHHSLVPSKYSEDGFHPLVGY